MDDFRNWAAHALELRPGDTELITDSTRRRLLNLTMSRDRRTSAVRGIAMDRMVSAFPIQVTAMLL
jgi:hypothetical protein